MAVVGGKLHAQQIQVYQYLDDWLVMDQSKKAASQSVEKVLKLVLNLGLVPNLEKSCLTPCQKMEYLGTDLDLTQSAVRPTKGRFALVSEAIEYILSKSEVPARVFLRLLGLMAACIDVIPWARLAMRLIQ